MYRYRESLTSFLVAALLMSASGILVAQTPRDTTAPKALSAEKLQTLIRHMNSGKEAPPLSEAISASLRLVHPFTRKNMLDDFQGVRHGISIGIADPARMIFYVRTGDGLRLYSSNLQLELLSAAVLANGVVAPVPVDSARPGFEAELQLWSGAALPANVQ